MPTIGEDFCNGGRDDTKTVSVSSKKNIFLLLRCERYGVYYSSMSCITQISVIVLSLCLICPVDICLPMAAGLVAIREEHVGTGLKF